MIKKFIFNHLSHNVRKHNLCDVRSTKTQISLHVRAVWSDSSLSTWSNFASLVIQGMLSITAYEMSCTINAIWNILVHLVYLSISGSLDKRRIKCGPQKRCI